jgi:hypothetical protein
MESFSWREVRFGSAEGSRFGLHGSSSSPSLHPFHYEVTTAQLVANSNCVIGSVANALSAEQARWSDFNARLDELEPAIRWNEADGLRLAGGRRA